MLECTVWDVQHGSATTLKTPNGKFLAIDLGTGSFKDRNETFSPLLHLKNWGVSQLHTVFITHPHRDHLDDIHNFHSLSPIVLTRPGHLSDEEIRRANNASDSPIIDKYIQISESYSCPVSDTTDYTPTNLGNVRIQTFSPCNAARSNINNHSLVIVVSYAGSKVLIPGDNEPVSWKELLEGRDFVEAVTGTDILIAPHHGRESGFCSELLEVLKPSLSLVIISDKSCCETTASSKYSDLAGGWLVHKRSGGSAVRKCLTTRDDGVIHIAMGRTDNGQGQPFLEVTID